MTAYRYLLDCAVLEEFLSLRSDHRRALIAIFRQIADNPYQPGETFFRDSTGREIQKRRFGNWSISFWPDHAVTELRIVGIQQARR
jgi:hypothetical protein